MPITYKDKETPIFITDLEADALWIGFINLIGDKLDEEE